MAQWNPVARTRAVGIALLCCAILPLTGTADALGQATPAAAELDIPLPRECVVAPRDAEFFPETEEPRAPATPAPPVTEPLPPFVPPPGEPANAETVTAVTATVREAIACRNANDFLRSYALFTDDMMAALFGGPATVDPDIRAVIDAEFTPLPRQQRIALTSVTEITLLPDGRAGAIVETLTAQRAFRDYLILEQDPASGRWLIDETRAMDNG